MCGATGHCEVAVRSIWPAEMEVGGGTLYLYGYPFIPGGNFTVAIGAVPGLCTAHSVTELECTLPRLDGARTSPGPKFSAPVVLSWSDVGRGVPTPIQFRAAQNLTVYQQCPGSPSACGGNGYCTLGECVCWGGFKGTACTEIVVPPRINLTALPTSVLGPVRALSKSACRGVYVQCAYSPSARW